MESGKKCPMDAEAQTLATFEPGSTPTYWLEENPYPVKDSTQFYKRDYDKEIRDAAIAITVAEAIHREIVRRGGKV